MLAAAHYKSKKDSNDKESIQSAGTTPVPGHQKGK